MLDSKNRRSDQDLKDTSTASEDSDDKSDVERYFCEGIVTISA